jgi:signal transduction histidine kinase
MGHDPRRLRSRATTSRPASARPPLVDQDPDDDQELEAVLGVMAAVSRAFAQDPFDLQKILDTLTTRTMQLLGDMCGVRLLVGDGSTTVMKASDHRDPEGRRLLREIGPIPTPTAEGISGQVILTAQPVMIPVVDTGLYRPGIRSPWAAYAEKFVPCSIVAVPWMAQGQILGSVLLVRHQPGRPFRQRELTILKDLTDRAAHAWTTAQQHQRLDEERQRLRARTEELQTLMAAAPVAIWVAHDPECKTISGNPASYRTIRMSDGSNVSKSAPVEERPHSYRTERDGREIAPEDLPLQLAARGQEVRNVEFDLVFDDGAVRNMFGSALPLLGADGTPRGSVGAFLDVAPLRDAIRARDEFLSIASHELKTPLTSLELYVAGVQRAIQTDRLAAIPPAELAERLAKITQQSRRMSSLVDQLLDVARIGGRRLVLDRVDCDLGESARLVVDRFHEQATAAGSSLSISAESSVIGCWDKGRIEQVVTNLISNAIKYGAGKPVVVRVVRSGERARLTVEDLGIGVSPAEGERIFDRFERGTAARHYGGLGLGLWIVKQIVESHGGHVGLTSTPGAGSTFRVELPLKPTSEPAASRHAS